VANEEKILSLYEGHAAVYVRGNAGAEVEFGSELLLAGRGIVNAIAPRDAGLLRARLRESRALHKAS
jgi:hypothetical protein